MLGKLGITSSGVATLLCFLWSLEGCIATAEPELLGMFYRADRPFPQFLPFWREAWSLKDATGETLQYAYAGMPVGGSVHVFLRNTGLEPLEVEEVRLEGLSLKRAIAFSEQKRKRLLRPASIYFADLTTAERERLLSAGEPVWWRVEPQPVSPGGTAQVLVRLRRTPQSKTLRLGLQWNGGTLEVLVPVRPDHPRMAGIFFSSALNRVYLYLHHPGDGGRKPRRILLDGRDVTRDSTIGYDETLDIVPVVLRRRKPLSPGSFHVFQAEYEDGLTASAGIRAWSGDFAYGMWGSKPGKEGDDELARWYVWDLYEHNINVQMEMVGSAAVRGFLKSEAGRQLCAELGIRRMVNEPGKGNLKEPWAYFLVDEPDCGDYRVQELKPHLRVGSLAQALVQRSRELRARDPLTPHLLNVDLTFKPDNWYIYGQLPDILAADPYYQERIRAAYYDHPDRLPLYTKALYVYAVGRVCQSACAPKPLHLILNSVHHIEKEQPFRFATPEEKRVEVYYALAVGAKGLSYWWYTPVPPYLGVGADDPQARALWRAIGLLGAEVRTAGPVLVRSCPAPLPVTASRRLWVRTLLAGLDTVVVICVNDDYASDRLGTVVRPLERAEVNLRLPAWLEPKEAFEITFEGPRDIAWERRGADVALHLGRVDLTRLILISADPQLRDHLQALYQEQFAAKVARLVAQKVETDLPLSPGGGREE